MVSIGRVERATNTCTCDMAHARVCQGMRACACVHVRGATVARRAVAAAVALLWPSRGAHVGMDADGGCRWVTFSSCGTGTIHGVRLYIGTSSCASCVWLCPRGAGGGVRGAHVRWPWARRVGRSRVGIPPARAIGWYLVGSRPCPSGDGSVRAAVRTSDGSGGPAGSRRALSATADSGRAGRSPSTRLGR